jgi:hypothetical protein
MTDTSAAVSKMIADRHRTMTPAERLLAASSMFEAARAIVESSLPSNLTVEERRLALRARQLQRGTKNSLYVWMRSSRNSMRSTSSVGTVTPVTFE